MEDDVKKQQAGGSEDDIVGVPGVQSHAKEFTPFNLLAAEIFKIRDGQIHDVEALGILVPYGAASGWE